MKNKQTKQINRGAPPKKKGPKANTKKGTRWLRSQERKKAQETVVNIEDK